jgi:hypothetical protein
MRMVLSYEPLAMRCASGDQPTHSTQPEWPLPVNSGVLVEMSHSRTVASPEPLARRVPSGLNDTHSTASE